MKKSSAIVLINMILAIISCNAFAIDWDDCSNSLRHLEDDADHAKRTSEELKDMSFAIKSLKGELSRCNSAYMDCNAIKNKIDEMTQQFNKTEITHTNRVAGIVFSFANMQ